MGLELEIHQDFIQEIQTSIEEILPSLGSIECATVSFYSPADLFAAYLAHSQSHPCNDFQETPVIKKIKN